MKKILSIIGYLLSVGVNIPHLVSVYVMAGNTDLPAVYNWVVLIVLDFGILVLALNDRDYQANIFAWVVCLLNLYFYWGPLPFPVNYSDWINLIPGLLFSAIPAFFINFFSELIADQYRHIMENDSDKIERLRVKIDNLSIELENDREIIEKYRPAFESLSENYTKKISVEGVKATICDCGRLVSAGSNKEHSRKCDCGNLIEW